MIGSPFRRSSTQLNRRPAFARSTTGNCNRFWIANTSQPSKLNVRADAPTAFSPVTSLFCWKLWSDAPCRYRSSRSEHIPRTSSRNGAGGPGYIPFDLIIFRDGEQHGSIPHFVDSNNPRELIKALSQGGYVMPYKNIVEYIDGAIIYADAHGVHDG